MIMDRAKRISELSAELESGDVGRQAAIWGNKCERLKALMGTTEFYSMEVEYWRWVEETRVVYPRRQRHGSIPSGGGRSTPVVFTEVEYVNLGPQQHERFCREYLIAAGQGTLLEEIDRV